MATNIQNRVPTLPGRVTLTPVAGQQNTYDLVRADAPTQVGTPVNKALLDAIGMHQLDYGKNGTVHALTGLNGASGLVSCLFTAAADYEADDTFTVDGTAYTIALQDGSDASDGLFVSGAVVSCVLDTVGKTVNFKASGGSLKYATGSQTAERTTVSSNSDYLFFHVTGLSFLPSMLYIQANESYVLIGIDPPDGSADLLFVNRSSITSSNGWVVYQDGGFEVHFGKASTGNTYFTVGTAYTYYAIGL